MEMESAIGRMHTCLDCGNAYDSEEGLIVHRHVEHPDVYHAARQSAARVNAKWSYKELVLVARAEFEIYETNPLQGVLCVLRSRFPDRIGSHQEYAE